MADLNAAPPASIGVGTSSLNGIYETFNDPAKAKAFQNAQLNMVEDAAADNMNTINLHKIVQAYIDGARG